MSDVVTNEPILRQSVKFGERYVSSALNKKLAGILGAGVYHGFVVKPGGYGKVLVTHEDNYDKSVAVVERNGYNLTITMDDPGYVTLPSNGTFFICLEAYYSETETGYQRIVARETVESHHVVLAKVVCEDITTQILPDMIDTTVCSYVAQRTFDLRLAKMFGYFFMDLKNMASLSNRLFKLEMESLTSKRIIQQGTTMNGVYVTEEVIHV